MLGGLHAHRRIATLGLRSTRLEFTVVTSQAVCLHTQRSRDRPQHGGKGRHAEAGVTGMQSTYSQGRGGAAMHAHALHALHLATSHAPHARHARTPWWCCQRG